MKKIVINKCYGGFGLSEEAVMKYVEYKGLKLFSDTQHGYINYYTVPVEEYMKVYRQCQKANDWKAANGLFWSERNIERDDPDLVKVVEELGSKANGRCAELTVVEIPDDISWNIEEYDGQEWIAEPHRTWG